MKGTSTKAAGAYNFEARPKANGKRKYRKDAEEAQPANQRATEEHYYESQAVRYEPLETPPTDSSVQPLYFYLDRPVPLA
jgi:hypothetical protein